MRLGSLTSRSWVLVGAVAGVLILAVTWLLVISPVRSDAGQLRDDAAGVDMQNLTIQTQNNKLRDQAKDQKTLQGELEAALQGLPSGPGLPVLSRQLATQAASRDVVLTGVSVGTPTATSPAVATTPTPDTGATDGAAAAASDTATGAAAAAASSADTGALAIPITVTSTGSALQQLFFLRDVQEVGPRVALVTSMSLAPSQGAADTASSIDVASTMTLQLTVFTNPLSKTERQQLVALTQSVGKG